MNLTNKYDLIVIGSGPGGRRAAIQAAKFSKKVLVIEKKVKESGASLFTLAQFLVKHCEKLL